MDAKLTLKFDKEIIEAAKEVASERGQSLSRIVENYLRVITREKREPTVVSEASVEIEISPFVKSLSVGTPLPNDFDIKNERYEYLIKKHS